MASKAQVNNFISKLSTLAIAEAKKRDKWVLPSVCIAQAALETGWGTSNLMTKANAYFGIKASGWKGKVYNSNTLECYDGRTYKNINACFRAYDSVEDSVKDYFDLITKSARYSAAVNEKNAEKAITAIKNGGYATDPTYISKIMNIINSYNLTKYDNFKDVAPVKETAKKLTEGDTVRLKTGAKYYDGQTPKSFVYKRNHKVKSITGDRVVITYDGITVGAVKASDLTVIKETVKKLTEGCTVKLNNGAKYYDGKIPKSFVYNRNHKVKSISGDRVVITYDGITVGAVKASDLTVI